MTKTPTIILDGTACGNMLNSKQIDELAAGRANILLTHHSKTPKSMRLTAEEFSELSRIRQRGWYYDRAPERLRTLAHYALEGERRYWCKVRRRGKTAKVVLDLVVTPMAVCHRWESNGADELKNIARDLGGKVVGFGIWNEIQVPSNQAESCATRMVGAFECVAQPGQLP